MWTGQLETSYSQHGREYIPTWISQNIEQLILDRFTQIWKQISWPETRSGILCLAEKNNWGFILI